MTMVKRLFAGAASGVLLVAGSVVPAGAASAERGPGLDGRALQGSLDAVHEAGMYGIYAEVRDGRRVWDGAAGAADVETRRPVHPNMRHRVGSITKTFVSVAILQQVERGTVELDAPVARYLPDLIPGERGRQITVRMLLNHTSHIGDHIVGAFPSLLEGSTASLDDHRLRTIKPEELVELGLAATPTGTPGVAPGSYSNTNYIIAGLLLEKVTGGKAETYVTRNVIRKAGLRHTSFPRTPHIQGPHSKAYESFYGIIDPPRDYSVYDMSWAGTAGAMVSTMADLNRFYRALLTGRLIGAEQLAQMRTTVPVAAGGGVVDYGLGLYYVDLPCGRFWGHDGGVFGMTTVSLSSPDGNRQLSSGVNLAKYQRIDENGNLELGPIDYALGSHYLAALCGSETETARALPFTPVLTDRVLVKR